ncbi:LCP family protein [Pseudonocardia acidicola]|uniref:LCP family protein n=1 Tax=Pseudonocardia acidicola TaxID=2724939 RepID=A0ABX1S7U0_9PSEU|nr:LCP family protein [Pseudonocardia acidicola]NMH97629.1 LCP family protein [Pseudonocardia acidicola]
MTIPAGTEVPIRRRRAARVARALVALVSALVIAITGYGWFQVHGLVTGLTGADVIAPGARTAEQNILLIGLDSRTDAQGNPLPQDLLAQLHAGASTDGGGLTDTMLLVHIPAGGGSATVISIPRDSYVRIAGGYGTHKINSAFAYGRNTAVDALKGTGMSGPALETQADAAGARTAIATVEQLTGVRITHFAAVNLVGFYDISQAVGGVPVCLLAPVHDELSGADFPAGPQTVQGAAALAFVRQRHGLRNGDLDRVRRQQAFLAGLARTVLSAGTLTDPAALGRLAAALQRAVTIDQGWDLTAFAGQLRLNPGTITFTTIPVGTLALQTPSDGEAVQVDPQEVAAFVRAVDAGSPAPAVPGSAPVAPGPASSGSDLVPPVPRPFTASAPACVN